MMGLRSFSPLRQWMGRRSWIGALHVNKLTFMASGDVVPRSMGTSQIERMMTSSYHNFATSKAIYSVCQKNGLYLSKQDINCRFYGRNTRIPDFRVCESFDDVLQLALEHLDQLRPNEIAVVWTYLSRTLLKWRPHQMKHIDLHSYNVETAQYELQLVDHILERTFNCLYEMSARDVTTITLAMAKIVQHIRNRPQKKRNAAQQAFRNVLFDESSNLNESIFYDLAYHSDQILPRFEVRHLSNLAYAHALLEYDPEFEDGSKLFTSIANESIGRMNEFNAHDISNMVWAYATLKLPNHSLFQAVGNFVSDMPDLKDFNPQSLANVVWAFSTNNVHHPDLFQKIGDIVASRKDLKSFQPQNIANIVWAYATANVQHPELFKIVSDHIVAMNDLRKYNSQDFSNIVWAFATANEQHPSLFRKIGGSINDMKDLKSFTPQGLSNIVWAYATLNVHHPNLFRKIGDNVVNMKDLKSFLPQELSNIVLAYATVNLEHPALFDKVGSSIIDLKVLSSFNSQDLANTAWAYSVLEIDVPLLFGDSFVNALEDNSQDLTTANCSQLYQWHLWQTQELSNSGLPAPLQEKCYQEFSLSDTTDSALQRDVVTQLDLMGLNPVEEYLTTSGYRLDALIEMNGKKVGVEVDGPSHFIGRRPNGSTALKHRQVVAIDNIPLISVPYWDWDKLKKDQIKKQQYLQTLLENVK